MIYYGPAMGKTCHLSTCELYVTPKSNLNWKLAHREYVFPL